MKKSAGFSERHENMVPRKSKAYDDVDNFLIQRTSYC